jgi:hypothetical protein
MEIEIKDITDFSRENILKIIEGQLDTFRLLKKGDMLSIFNFFRAIASNEKVRDFVTESPILLENKKNIKKNTGITIITRNELIKKEGEKWKG